jgi:hypothetical protein
VPRFVSQTIATGQVISPDQIYVKTILLTAGASVDARAILYDGAGNIAYVLASKAGDSNEFLMPSLQMYSIHLKTPLLDLSGTGATITIEY